MTMSFLKDFDKKLKTMKNITTDFSPPSRWYSTGNLALNRQMSGSFVSGIPESRVTILAGPSGSGKTFLACNMVREAQAKGAHILYIDSENAVDGPFLTKIGVNPNSKFNYIGLTTFDEVTEILASFITGYEKDYGRNNPEAPPMLIVVDSLDMLLTTKEDENFSKGVQKGDQGQRTKQLKHLLRTVTTRIAQFNISFIGTHQVYQNQDVLNGEGVWIVNNAVKYSASQIFLCTKLKLKEGTDILGIRMRVEAYKSRFTKTGSKIEIEVPYTKGMNPYSGFLEAVEEMGVVSKGGSWYTFIDTNDGDKAVKFQKKNLDEDLVAKILAHPDIVAAEAAALDVMNSVEADPDSYEVAQLGALEDDEVSED